MFLLTENFTANEDHGDDIPELVRPRPMHSSLTPGGPLTSSSLMTTSTASTAFASSTAMTAASSASSTMLRDDGDDDHDDVHDDESEDDEVIFKAEPATTSVAPSGPYVPPSSFAQSIPQPQTFQQPSGVPPFAAYALPPPTFGVFPHHVG